MATQWVKMVSVTQNGISITPYSAEKKAIWNEFVKNAKNTHFFFQRDYMEYHADRFEDASLFLYEQDKLLAVLPGSKHHETYVSHGGLTFGGMILDKKIKMSEVMQIFSSLLPYLKAQDFQVLRYKAIPHIYHEIPAEEDLYALFRHQAVLVRRDISSSIDLRHPLSWSGGKKNGIAKAKKNGVIISDSHDFDQFHTIMTAVLMEKYKTQPTHNNEELKRLHAHFPENIKLHGAFHNGEMIAGVVMYIHHYVAHTQYMCTSELGRDLGALDLLLFTLIHDKYAQCRYFDFGISTEQQGKYLNSGLIAQKEMFGARGIAYDTYEMTL